MGLANHLNFLRQGLKELCYANLKSVAGVVRVRQQIASQATIITLAEIG